MVSCGGNAKNGVRKAQELSGAGATFPLPFYNVVFENFAQVNGDIVAYGGVGSGGGVRNLRDKVVDFAGSDAFLTDKEMAEMAPVVHVPTCMGAVVVAYNLDGVKELKLTGEVVADIFAGKIKMWNDERLTALNPDVTLPAEISQTKNSIGYVGSEYAFAQKIPYAIIQNARGEFILPTAESISAAAAGTIPADTRTSITNADAAGAYPISTFTWMIIYKEQHYSDRSKEQAEATLDLLQYILSDEAQNITTEVHYAPLPAKAKELSMKNLKAVTYDGVAILQ